MLCGICLLSAYPRVVVADTQPLSANEPRRISRARRVERWVEPPVDPYAVGVPAAGDPVAAGITGGGGGGVIGSQALAGGGPAGI
jgi:hypothetical protein